jgi:capsid protein
MMLTELKNRLTRQFASGYDAIASTGKRKAASSVLKHEDEQLKQRDRKNLIGTGRDLARNYSIVSWAVRKHLDYVTQFDFQMKTENDELNEQVEQLMREWQRPDNCDIAGRHPFPRMLRLLESRRIIDGDSFLLKRSQGSLQAIEGDLIRDPDDHAASQQNWFNGVLVNTSGRALAYGLHKRTGQGQFKFSRRLKARNVIHHACFERFDQVRGISPLAAAFNTFRDCYEGIDFNLALMKAQSLFAMIVTSSAEDGLGAATNTGSGYDVDFGKGPIKLEMEPGEDAKFLKSDNPGGDTQNFLNLVLGMALKSLDLPFNFYDESHTNFFGSRAAWLLYDRSCHAKRADVLETLRRITVWRMQLWIQDGLLRLPPGMTINDMSFLWINKGMPWWDPAKEINGDLLAISAGLDNPYRICAERGRGDYEDNIKMIAKASAFAEEQEVAVSFAPQANPADEEIPEIPEEDGDETLPTKKEDD